MTDLATALATQMLSPFEGQDVIRSAIEIPNAAGGLREAMKFEPTELHLGEEVYVVLRCAVKKVRFDPIKDTDCLARIHVFDAEEATMVDAGLVKAQLDEQRERIQLAKDRASGVRALSPPKGLSDEAVTKWEEHQRAEHDTPDADCVLCDEDHATDDIEPVDGDG